MLGTDGPGRAVRCLFSNLNHVVKERSGVVAWTLLISVHSLLPLSSASAGSSPIRYQPTFGYSKNRLVVNPIPGTIVDYGETDSMAPAAAALLVGWWALRTIPTLPEQRRSPEPIRGYEPPPQRPVRQITADNSFGSEEDPNAELNDDRDQEPEPEVPRPAPVPQRPRPERSQRPQVQSPQRTSSDDERATTGRTTAAGAVVKMLSLGPMKRLAHNSAYLWNGCDRMAVIQGGNGRNCGTDYLQPAFAEHANRHLLSCVQAAAAKVGKPQPVKLFISHMGCYANRSVRGGGSLSNHALARAMDIASITMIDANGGENKISSHVRNYSGQNKIMYDTFRECWRRNLPRPCAGSKGSIGIPRSSLGGNGDHNDHIHLEFPTRCG